MAKTWHTYIFCCLKRAPGDVCFAKGTPPKQGTQPDLPVCAVVIGQPMLFLFLTLFAHRKQSSPVVKIQDTNGINAPGEG